MKKIPVAPHWSTELSKLRCWIQGWKSGRSIPGQTNIDNFLPGEDVLRQIQMAINDAKDK
jgi:hypothetical protein